jgi:hypothetical protein
MAVGFGLLVAGWSVLRIGVPSQLDVNAADAATLGTLPGLTREDAERIVYLRGAPPQSEGP